MVADVTRSRSKTVAIYLLGKRLNKIISVGNALANNGGPDSRDHKSKVLIFAVGQCDTGTNSGAIADALNDSYERRSTMKNNRRTVSQSVIHIFVASPAFPTEYTYQAAAFL